MEKTSIHTDGAPRAIGPYSPAIRSGNMVFCSGQIGLTPDGQLAPDIVSQTRQVLINLRAILEASGSDLQHVMKTTVFLARMSDFDAMNSVYAEVFTAVTPHPPARSTVAVAELPRGALVEIEATAMTNPNRYTPGPTVQRG